MVVASSEREKATETNNSTHTFMYATNMFNYQKIYCDSTRIGGVLARAGHVQSMRGVIQSDERYGGDGCLCLVLEQYCRRIFT